MSARAKLHPVDEQEFERQYGSTYALPQHRITDWFSGPKGALGVIFTNAYSRWGYAVFVSEPPFGIICFATLEKGFDNQEAAQTALSIAVAEELSRRASRARREVAS
jgi:hypothetical protein